MEGGASSPVPGSDRSRSQSHGRRSRRRGRSPHSRGKEKSRSSSHSPPPVRVTLKPPKTRPPPPKHMRQHHKGSRPAWKAGLLARVSKRKQPHGPHPPKYPPHPPPKKPRHQRREGGPQAKSPGPSTFGAGIQRAMCKAPSPAMTAAFSSSGAAAPMYPPEALGVSVPMGLNRARPFPCITMLTDEQIHNLMYGILLHRPHVATEWAHAVTHARPGIWRPQADHVEYTLAPTVPPFHRPPSRLAPWGLPQVPLGARG